MELGSLNVSASLARVAVIASGHSVHLQRPDRLHKEII